MALMTSMRNRMHVVLWALLILFLLSMTIGGLVGGANIIDQIIGRVDPSKVIAKINGEIVTPSYFSQRVSNQLDQMRANGQTITDRQLDQVRKQVWDNLLRDIIVKQTVEEYGFSATDEEVVYHLKNNPPSFLKTNPRFMTDGKFDPVKYDEAVSNPEGDEWAPLEQLMKETYIPNYKLHRLILSSVAVSEEEVKEEYIKRNTKYTIDVIHVTDKMVDKEALEPSDDLLLETYQERIEEFSHPENRNLRGVSWKKDPSPTDTLAVSNEAQEIKERILAGEDFAKLADLYTEDPSNEVTPDSGKGGDLGWFGKGQMVPAFEEAAFNAKENEIVGPILSRFGYHIIKVFEKKTDNEKEQIHAAHILLKIEISPNTLDELRRKATLFSYDAQDYGFDAALDTHQVEAFEATKLNEESIFVPKIGLMRAAVRFAFNVQLGEVSDLMENENFFVVFTLDSIIAPGPTPFDEVKEQIRRELVKESSMEETEIIANNFLTAIDSGFTFQDLIKENESLEHAEKDVKTLSRGFKTIGKSNFITGALLNAKAGDLIGPLKTSRGYALINVLEIQEFDSTNFEIQKDVLRKNLLIQKQNSVYANWLQAQKDESKIIDNRKYYF